MIRTGSLFAGIGGLELGLEMTGHFKTCWQVELDEYARRVLAKHWPEIPRWPDVKTFPPDDWTQEMTEVDLVAGGFPCQDISVAGKGAGLLGDRSGLFFEIIRITGILRPRWLLMENVSALMSRGLDQCLAAIDEAGYNSEWHCLTASSCGALHRRDRVFIISTRKDIPFRRIITERPDPRDWDIWDVEPDIPRITTDKVHKRQDRLKGLGNAVVPQVGQFIGQMIAEAIR
jgi:DNA (cytosine-5)-methyltransferase 1